MDRPNIVLFMPDQLRRDDPAEALNLAGDPAVADIEHSLKDQVMTWLFETSDVIPWEADPRF